MIYEYILYVISIFQPRDTFVIGESYNRGNPEPRTSQSSSNVFVIGSRSVKKI